MCGTNSIQIILVLHRACNEHADVIQCYTLYFFEICITHDTAPALINIVSYSDSLI